MYTINPIIDDYGIEEHYEIVDSYGNFVQSADTYSEAYYYKTKLENNDIIRNTVPKTKTYLATYLRAKARWITKNGKHLQVPIEEPTVFKSFVTASSIKDAVVKVHRDNKDYVITNIQLS